jgi:hypothetical protein
MFLAQVGRPLNYIKLNNIEGSGVYGRVPLGLGRLPRQRNRLQSPSG